MKENTLELIRTILSSDETVTRELADNILRICRKPTVRRSLIGAKQVWRFCTSPGPRFVPM